MLAQRKNQVTEKIYLPTKSKKGICLLSKKYLGNRLLAEYDTQKQFVLI